MSNAALSRWLPWVVAGLFALFPMLESTFYTQLVTKVLIICFVVVVIGGIGSVKGAMAASLMIGLADTFGQVLLPEVAGMVVYVLMAAVLVWRPAGLFGKA